MRCSAALFFPSSARRAQALYGALRPETDHADVPKTRARLALEDAGLRVELDAVDLPSLRAALNSYLRWVDAAEKAAQLGE